MPPPVHAKKPAQDLPSGVRAYAAHGVVFTNLDRDEATADCPFCDSTKFSVNTQTSKGRCWSCKWTGNGVGFLRKLHQLSTKATTDEQYQKLAESRGLLKGETLKRWGACVSIMDGKTWLLPGYGANGSINQLYRYVKMGPEGKHTLLATPGLSHGLHYGVKPNGVSTVVELCEGPWDGMAFEEAMLGAKQIDGRLVSTSSAESSLMGGRAVASPPGCNVFREDWTPLLEGKQVRFWYDNDHPQEKGGQKIQAGLDGTKQAVRVLSHSDSQPSSTHYLNWGKGGFDPSLPSGYDIRDALRDQPTPVKRAEVLLELEKLLVPIPSEWVTAKANGKKGAVQIEPLECTSWRELDMAWRKAMKWTAGLRGGLVCMLSSVASTGLPGDQLWFKIVSPPSGGKSTLCEGLAVAKDCVRSVSTLKGFHSGYQMDKEGSEDTSLISRVDGKTLVLKDGDTLLTQPNLPQILAEARDIYDRVSRTSYRNKMSREYEGINMTFLLCGTSSLRTLDSSELGQRFLDWVIMEEIHDGLESEVNTRKLGALRSMMFSGIDGSRDGDTPEMLKAKRLTGGYVQYLRRIAQEKRADLQEPSDEFLEYISTLAKFVAVSRARPSKKQDEEVSRELSTRLATQLFVLATAASIVLNLKGPDCDMIRELLRKVAVHTARGRTMAIIEQLAPRLKEGLELKAVSTLIGELSHETKKLMFFLRRIKAVEAFQQTKDGQPRGPIRYRLTDPTLLAFQTATTQVSDEFDDH